jgi:hypothetical protein
VLFETASDSSTIFYMGLFNGERFNSLGNCEYHTFGKQESRAKYIWVKLCINIETIPEVTEGWINVHT